MARTRDLPALCTLDYFAGALARLGDVERAAASLGRGPVWGHAQFRKLCADLSVPVSRRGDRRA